MIALQMFFLFAFVIVFAIVIVTMPLLRDWYVFKTIDNRCRNKGHLKPSTVRWLKTHNVKSIPLIKLLLQYQYFRVLFFWLDYHNQIPDFIYYLETRYFEGINGWLTFVKVNLPSIKGIISLPFRSTISSKKRIVMFNSFARFYTLEEMIVIEQTLRTFIIEKKYLNYRTT